MASSRRLQRLFLFAFLTAFLLVPALSLAITVPDTYQLIPQDIGTTVTVQGFFSIEDDSLLVEDIGLYRINEALPPETYLVMDGVMPDPVNRGWEVEITGTLDTTTADPAYEGFATLVLIHVTSVVPIGPAKGQDGDERGDVIPPDDVFEGFEQSKADCDSCKFAIILSGGINNQNNHKRYWNDVVKKRSYKTGAGYCESNITTLYYNGTARDTTQIPSSKITTATEANFNAAIAAIKAKIAACEAQGKKSEFQFLVTNHGKSDGSIHLFGNGTLTPGETKAKIKELVDAGVDEVYAEFGQCYGGAQVDSLKTLASDSTSTTSFHLSSAVSGSQTSRCYGPAPDASRDLKWDVFEDAFVTARAAGKSWSEAHAYADSVEKLDYDSNTGLYGGLGIGREDSQYFERISKKFTAGAQELEFKVAKQCSTICVQFPGADADTRCANVTVLCEKKVGNNPPSWVKIKTWNWNVGKKKYFRTNGPDATGKYKIISHSNGYPTIVHVTPQKSTAIAETPSDGNNYNATSIGSRGNGSSEFNYDLGAGSGGGFHFFGWDDGTDTEFMPAVLGGDNFDQLVIDVPMQPDPERPWLYMGGDPTQPYADPALLTIWATDITDELEQPIEFMPMFVVVAQPGTPYPAQFFEAFFQRSPSGEVEPLVLDLGNIYGQNALQIDIQIPGGGTVKDGDKSTSFRVEFDAILIDPFGPVVSGVRDDLADKTPALLLDLDQNTPNPFNPSTEIAFDLPAPGAVELVVYDVAGRRVRTLANEWMEAGRRTFRWDGRDDNGREMPSGVYFYQLRQDQLTATRKMMLLR